MAAPSKSASPWIRRRARPKSIFSGTSSQVPTNFNAPLAVCRAAIIIYGLFRCLVQDNIPLNDGCLDPLELVVPVGSFLNPAYPAAVVAGGMWKRLRPSRRRFLVRLGHWRPGKLP